MKLLFAGSECAPFFKTGGLGDVMGALPKTIAKTTDNDVRVVLPFFTGMAEEYKNQLSFVTSFYVKVGWRDQYCGVLKAPPPASVRSAGPAPPSAHQK